MSMWMLLVVSVAGAAVGALITRRLSGVQVCKKVGAASREGGAQAALACLNSNIPPSASVPYFRVIPHRERAALLALLGRPDELRSELDVRQGSLLQRANIDAVALLGLVYTSGQGLDELRSLSQTVESEGGLSMRLLATRVRAYAGLATAICAKKAALDNDLRWAIEAVIDTENGALPVLLSAALMRWMEGAGKPQLAAPHRARVAAAGF